MFLSVVAALIVAAPSWARAFTYDSDTLLADPRARHAYTRQAGGGVGAELASARGDEATQCRRCEWPAFLAADATVKELLTGGRYVRAFLAVDEAKPVGDPIRQATQAALDFFRAQAGNYPPPYGLDVLPAWADAVPSPIQVSLAEPAQNPAYWSPNEAGVSVSLVAGEALLSTSDFSWQGRGLPLSLDRTYRSGTLGYGPLGSAGWSSTLFAHLREIGTTGEVEYHDGRGNVYRFLPPGTPPPAGYEADQPSTYVVPRGLSLRLRKVGLEQGWQLFDRHHNVMTFDAEGKLVEIADRHRQGAAANRQGNTVRFHHDVFGQLLSIEDDYGRTYAFEYYDNPKPTTEGGDGPRYGLLRRVTDFAGRTIEYEWDDQRRLVNVKLPEVTNPVADYAAFSYTGASRPTIQYRYYESGQWSVTSGQPATSATLHGDFAKLRLEGFIQPGSTVLRARFEYDATTGRATKVGYPTPPPTEANDPAHTVAWQLASEPTATAAPTTKAVISAPWGHVTEETLTAGRTTRIVEKSVETATGGGMTPQDLTTTYAYEDDGRLNLVGRADSSSTAYVYAGSGDRLAKGNVTSSTTGGIGTSFAYGADNIVQSMTDGEGRTTTFPVPSPGAGPITAGYQAEGVLTTTTFDPFGRATTSHTAGTAPVVSQSVFGPDARGRANAGLVASTTAGGVTETLSYDQRWDVRQRTTSYGVSTTLGNDDWGRAVDENDGQSTGVLAPVNARTQRAFDPAGRLVRERRWQTGIGWVETRYEYNARDQITKVTQTGVAGSTPGAPLTEGTTTSTYDAFGRLATSTSAAGILTTTGYDSAGRVASTQTGISGARRRAYDAQGRLVFTTDGHEGFWRGRFDGWGRLYQEESSTGALTEHEYDKTGGAKRDTVFADATKTTKLAETTFTTTSFGAVAESRELISGGGSPSTSLITTNTFDGSGRITDTRRGPAGSQRLEQHLDYETGTGRTLGSTDAAGNKTTYVYQSALPWASQIVSTEPAVGSQPAITLATTPTYDALGRVVHEERAGTIIDRSFDEAGNVLASSTGGSNQLTTAYDSRGLALKTAKPAIGAQVTSGYDPDGRLLASNVTREGGSIETTSYAYDASGRMASRTRPGSPAESFTYNADDTLKSWVNRQGITITHTYDPANRLTRRTPALASALPAGLAPLDSGDVMTYDALGRLTSAGILPQPSAPSPDPSSLVTYSDFDTRGLPKTERIGFWPTGSVIERHYDAFGNTIATLLPQGIAGSAAFAGHAASFDALDRMTSVTQANPDGTPNLGAPFGAALSWSGAARPIAVTTPVGLATAQGFDPTTGRLAGLAVSTPSSTLGQLSYGWDVPRDLKLGRAASAQGGLASGLGYAARYDGVQRMTGAETGRGNLAGGTTQGMPLGSWNYAYGKADELVSITEAIAGTQQYASGPEGRITSRTGPDGSEAFSYDTEGRRIEDAASRYTWDWRGRLVAVEPKSGAHTGEKVNYSYDATGRTLSRTELGPIPVGKTDADRPFIAKRAFVWDGQRLAAEAGLNFQDQPLWRQQYAPGQRGLDDAPLIRIEKDLQSTPSTRTYALLRDEMGTPLAVAEDTQPAPRTPLPALLARYQYSPYGETHLELGPELVAIAYDAAITKVGTTAQTTTPNQTIAGALKITTTIPLAPASLDAGLVVEELNTVTGSWDKPSRTNFAIGTDSTDPAQLLVMRLAGWAKSLTYRITIKPTIADAFGRAIQLPAKEAQGVEAFVQVPADGTTPPSYARKFNLKRDPGAAANTLGGAFPSGQTSGFQGAWTDPVTNLGFHRARWLDKTNASWLSPDPLGPIDSLNTYSSLAWKPQTTIDPSGRILLVAGDYQETALVVTPQGTHESQMGVIEIVGDHLREIAPYAKVSSSGVVTIERLDPTKRKGSLLIKRLVDSPHVVVIQARRNVRGHAFPVVPLHTIGANFANSRERETAMMRAYIDRCRATHVCSSDTVVEYDPSRPSSVYFFDRLGLVDSVSVGFNILLAHELIHALHFVEGTMDYTLVPHTYYDRYGRAHTTTVYRDEFVTTGVPHNGANYHTPDDITENDIRREAGVPELRPVY